MAYQIVTVNVNQTVAPTPSTLQQTGALISLGGTTIQTSTAQLIPNYTTLAALLNTSAEPAPAAEIQAMATTFFAQGNTASVYVLELGAQATAADGITALQNWIGANPGIFYSYLCPKEWDGDSTFVPFLQNYESTEAKTYFYVTTTTSNYTKYPATLKCVKAYVEAPSAPSTEFSAAADFYVNLNYNPSAINRLTPNAFAYVYGVTPYPTSGNAAVLSSLKTAGVNVIGTGAEGGITNTIMLFGTTMDGNDFAYWYSVDWVQINVNLNLANEIINGSNNPQAPLYYDQHGIDRLQARAQQTMNSAIAFGMALSPATVVATPFYTYVQQNPGDYKTGTYNGLGVTYTPRRGFESITFNIQVSQFVVTSATNTSNSGA